MSLGLLCALLAAGGAPDRGPVLVVHYQAVGFEPGEADGAQSALEAAFAKLGVSAATDANASRASGMCGEDAACLASLGARAHARWVLAFGLGKVGPRVLESFVLVEVAPAAVRARDSHELAAQELDWPAEATRTAARFSSEMPAPVELTPRTAEAPSRTVLVWEKPTPESRARPYAWATGGTGAALLVAGGIVGLLARSNYQQLEDTPVDNRSGVASQQRVLNHTADGLWIGGVVVAAASATLFWLSREPAK